MQRRNPRDSRKMSDASKGDAEALLAFAGVASRKRKSSETGDDGSGSSGANTERRGSTHGSSPQAATTLQPLNTRRKIKGAGGQAAPAGKSLRERRMEQNKAKQKAEASQSSPSSAMAPPAIKRCVTSCRRPYHRTRARCWACFYPAACVCVCVCVCECVCVCVCVVATHTC